MKYTLFDTMTGVITDRRPFVTEGKICFSFENHPEKATLFAKAENGATWYRDLDEFGNCEIPAVIGRVNVWVKVFGLHVKTWECEPIVTTELSDGRILVCPHDTNLPDEMARIRVENQEIRDEQERLHEEIAQISARIEKMLEGWNIT